MRFQLLLTLCLLLTSSTVADCDDAMLFISSFAAGDQGAIHTCRFDLETRRRMLRIRSFFLCQRTVGFFTRLMLRSSATT